MKRGTSPPPSPTAGVVRQRLKPLHAAGAVVLCAGVAVVLSFNGSGTDPLSAAASSSLEMGRTGDGAPPESESAAGRTTPEAAARKAVKTWLETLRALEEERVAKGGEIPAISLSSYPSPKREAAFQKLLAHLSADNAAETHRLLSGHAAGDGTALTEAEWRAILEKWGKLDGSGAVDLLAGQEDGLRAKVPALLRGWARADAPAAAAWLRARGELEEQREQEAVDALEEQSANRAQATAREDTVGSAAPESAAIGYGGGTWSVAACRELVLGWMETDLDAPAHWLNGNPRGPARDAAAEAFAAGSAELDPAGALAWAASIGDASWRASALETVGRHWLREDPEAALAALREAGCAPETISAMMTGREPGTDLLQAAGTAALSGHGVAEAGIFISGKP